MGVTLPRSISDEVVDREKRDDREAAIRFASLPVRAGTITPDIEQLFYDVNRLMQRLSD